MATIMTKRGQQDNILTYEHFCDTNEDLQDINPAFITLGSIAVVLHGTAGLEFYMADSNKEWVSLMSNLPTPTVTVEQN